MTNASDLGRWARNHDACRNCGTTGRDHAGRGCCALCLPAWREKIHAENWDPNAPGPISRWPLGWLLSSYPDTPTPILALHRAEVLRQLERRLDRLRHEEWLRTGDVTALDVEEQLNRVWRSIRPRPSHRGPSPFAGGATWITAPFNQRQLTALSALLIDLTRHMPWRINFGEWWEAVAKPAQEERLNRSLG